MIQPVGDRVLIKRDNDETQTAGGIIIPSAHAEKSDTGTVLAVGLGRQTDTGEFIRPDLKEGDRVIFQKSYGTDMKIDGMDCVMLESYYVYTVLDEE